MRIAAYYSHLNGYEWMKVRRPGMWEQIEEIVALIDAEKCRTKVSREKTMLGKMLYSPVDMNAWFKREFESRDWKERRRAFWMTDDAELIRQTLRMQPDEQKRVLEEAGKVPIGSKTQTDFVKDRVAVEVQLGKYTFIPYDLFLKHMAFYIGDEIDLGVEIVPMKVLQAGMSSGPGYYENALHQIVRQGRGVPAVPLVLIGIEPDAATDLTDLAEDELVEGEGSDDETVPEDHSAPKR